MSLYPLPGPFLMFVLYSHHAMNSLVFYSMAILFPYAWIQKQNA